MQEQSVSIGTTLKVVGKMLADTMIRSHTDHRKNFQARDYCTVYVKNGVANAASPYGCHVRFKIEAPDGQYDINDQGNLTPTRNPIIGHMNTLLEFPYDPEIVKPKEWKSWGSIDYDTLLVLLPFVRAAKDAKELIMMEKGGMGFSRSNDTYIEYPFGIPRMLTLNPLFLEVAFTDALRFPMIEIYQEIRPGDLESKEGPQAPLMIGYGWYSGCTLIKPIVDEFRTRGYYN